MKGMYTCKICGRDFPLIFEERYTARSDERSGLAAAFGGPESEQYDAFDCPHCGCQNIVQSRKRIWDPRKDYGVINESELENCDKEKEEKE